MHAINYKLVVANEQIVIRPIVVVALTYNQSVNEWSGGSHFLWLVNPLM